ncbi:MAG: glycine--tRNA ligase subunit beta [Gammaproteobacteria bacterium]|nr:glycine--tRNA ligase subunit beta [Gammaproteobacteria bacterium]
MTKTDSLLLEIGTEELPPQDLWRTAQALGEELAAALADARLLAFKSPPRVFGAPRRLAVRIDGVLGRQQPETIERRGPPLAAAFAADGTPTKATLGFARSCNADVADLVRLSTERGEFLGFRERRAGLALKNVLEGLLHEVIKKLPTGRRMRWGAGDTEFIRPVHWIVLLYGTRVLPVTVLGLKAGRRTRGHRFHGPASLPLPSAQAYEDTLAQQGHVIADFLRRQDQIRAQVEHLAEAGGGSAHIEPALLALVTALVEWPTALLGSFDSDFLQLPAEVLIATMRDHQKYFPVVDQQGRLRAQFITVANVEPADPASIRAGNERVLAARFADARFFWETDQSRRLEEHGTGLAEVAFEQRLGSLADKSARVARLAGDIASGLGLDVAQAQRAATLAKCDLITGMVGEFPELQGVMGGYYARHQGEEAQVAQAISDQYRPRFANDSLPSTRLGKALALADKLDTVVGIYTVGLVPTGDKDPFALRRTTIGILRLLDDLGADGDTAELDLPTLLEWAFGYYRPGLLRRDLLDPLKDFVTERLRQLFLGEFESGPVEAALARGARRIHDLRKRLEALAAFEHSADAAALVAANKRIRNILKQAEGDLGTEGGQALEEAAERHLQAELEYLRPHVVALTEDGAYAQALARLSGLRPAVDAFFDSVLVMTDDLALRRSRMRLLSELAALFALIGDVSLLKTGG